RTVRSRRKRIRRETARGARSLRRTGFLRQVGDFGPEFLPLLKFVLGQTGQRLLVADTGQGRIGYGNACCIRFRPGAGFPKCSKRKTFQFPERSIRVGPRGIEPLTSALRTRRSPS